MSTMSPFYLTIVDFAYPLLFFGLFFALLQFSFGAKDYQDTSNRLQFWIKRCAYNYWQLWGFFSAILGIYILCKIIATAIGWIMSSFGGEIFLWWKIPDIDSWVGLSCILFLVVLVIITIYRLLKMGHPS